MTLPSSGAVLVLDSSGRLLQANSTGKKLLGASDGEPMRKHYQYYCSLENTAPVRNIIEKAINNRSSFSQKIMILKDGDLREWFCIVTTMKNITGRFRGILFNGFDITEELGKNRLSNWAQLAHDMQTNLSTILLNAQCSKWSRRAAIIRDAAKFYIKRHYLSTASGILLL